VDALGLFTPMHFSFLFFVHSEIYVATSITTKSKLTSLLYILMKYNFDNLMDACFRAEEEEAS
jgi:hypothetical protein